MNRKISLGEFRILRRVTKKFRFEFPNCLPACTRRVVSQFIAQEQRYSTERHQCSSWIESAKLRSSVGYYWPHQVFEGREALHAAVAVTVPSIINHSSYVLHIRTPNSARNIGQTGHEICCVLSHLIFHRFVATCTSCIQLCKPHGIPFGTQNLKM
jgi:hypothetical protein